jgi:hypothetical protein
LKWKNDGLARAPSHPIPPTARLGLPKQAGLIADIDRPRYFET